MKRKLLLVHIVVGLCGLAAAHAGSASVTGASTEYKAGQVWRYKTARGAEESRIIILDVQSQGKKGSLVHIRIENLRVPHCGGLNLDTAIEHLAVPEKLLRKSTTVLEKEQTSLPGSYFDEYKEWQKNRHKEIVKRPLAEVALPEVGCPVIVNFRQSV
jgi:hypothetical protein